MASQIKFTYFNPSIHNLYILSNSGILSNDYCTITLNDKYHLYVPLLSAAYISKKITNVLLLDRCSRDFCFNLKKELEITDSIFEKITRMFNFETIILDITDIPVFTDLSQTLDAEILKKFLTSVKEDEYKTTPLPKQVFAGLIAKYTAGMTPEEYSFELGVSSKHFMVIHQYPETLELCKNDFFLPLIEQLISHPNLSIFDENVLLYFLLHICEINQHCEYLFQYVYLEYCTPNAIKQYISYLEEHVFTTNTLKATLTCFSRRLIQNTVPATSKFLKNRHMCFYLDSDGQIPISTSFKPGLLRYAHQTNHLKLETSARSSRELYNILEDSENYFISDDEPNSWISATFLHNSSVSLTHYMIRSRNTEDGHYPQSWMLEGKNLNDPKWTLLDKHLNEPFSKLQMKAFQVTNQNFFNQIRLTQIGPNTSNDDFFDICAFDIFGTFNGNESQET